MNEESLLTAFDNHNGPGVIASSDGKGEVNAAVFGSVRRLDDQHVAMALGEGRTLDNLKFNGRAVYLFYREGKTVLEWQGARLYLDVVRFEDEGGLFASLVAEAEQQAGKMAARMLRCAVVFRIDSVRPLIDFGA